MMNKQTKKADRVTCAIMAAFMLMSGTHFACRYDVGAMIDDMFQKVSAETVQVAAPTPEPVAAAPVMAPTSSEEVINTASNQTITRNPFAVPAVAQAPKVNAGVQTTRPNLGSPATGTYQAGMPQGQMQAQPAPQVQESPHLKGVVQSGNKSMAIIEYKGSSAAYKPGQSVGGYTVNDIGSSSVGLSGGNGSVRISVGG